MAKRLIRLTENDLHRIVKESVNKVLMEFQGNSPAGISTDEYGRRTNQEGGPFGRSPLDDLHDEPDPYEVRRRELADQEKKRLRGW